MFEYSKTIVTDEKKNDDVKSVRQKLIVNMNVSRRRESEKWNKHFSKPKKGVIKEIKRSKPFRQTAKR